MILVGDTAGDNHLGYDDTIPVTMEESLSNTAAVNRAVENAMVIGDMPLGSTANQWRPPSTTRCGS
jgi:3-methyl-2-oxobutanoate hydroxymethyltransferase